jgi:chemotaxis signal transduction protein
LAEKERKEGENFLVFEVGGYTLAVRIGQVLKVMDKNSADPDLEMVDLTEILGNRMKSADFRLEVMMEGKVKSVPVDYVEPIKDLRLAVWLDFPKIMRRKNNKIIEGFFFDGSRMVTLIDLERIAA